MAIDDSSRVAYAQPLPMSRAIALACSCERQVAYYAGLSIRIREVLTDDGDGCRSQLFAQACRDLTVHHRFPRAYTPRTNGKAERLIQTALREWTYGRADKSRIGLSRNNLLRLHTWLPPEEATPRSSEGVASRQ